MDTRHILDLPRTGQIGPPRPARRLSSDKVQVQLQVHRLQVHSFREDVLNSSLECLK